MRRAAESRLGNAGKVRRRPLLARLRRGEAASLALAWLFVLQLLLEGAAPLLARAAGSNGAAFSIICTLEGARPSPGGAQQPVHDCPLCVAGSCCCLPAAGTLPSALELPRPAIASAGLLPLPTSHAIADARSWQWQARAPPA